MPMEAAVARELDKQIATVKDCKFLKEEEVIRLCEQVHTCTPRG
jgi:hypothetical protein